MIGGNEVDRLIDQYAESGKRRSSFEDWADEPVPHGEFAPKAFAALRGVIQVHSPITISGKVYCGCCQPAVYPCRTIQMITTAIEASTWDFARRS